VLVTNDAKRFGRVPEFLRQPALTGPAQRGAPRMKLPLDTALLGLDAGDSPGDRAAAIVGRP
jgi:hypothetical protein